MSYHNRGCGWLQKNEYDKAIADYTTSIRLKPAYAKAYYNRGHAQYEKREYDKAIADYTEAIRLEPGYTPPTNSEASPGTRSATTTRRSRITAKRFGWTPKNRSFISSAAKPGAPGRSTTRRSRT